MNKKLHPYYKTGVYGWLGEEVDDNDYIICPICGNVLGMNYWDYQAENDGDNKCPECEQELDYSEIYDFEDTCYFEQLLEIKESKIADLEAKLAESENKYNDTKELSIEQFHSLTEMLKSSQEEYYKLEQQLAEKEKERHEEWKTGKEWKWEWQKVNQQLEQANQDKISFAVEQFRQLKIDLNARRGEYYTEKGYKKFACSVDIINTIIDNQIKQLKEIK
jgi:ssDNA-binding Zn-finger/Zn-ribbon topoisomerase 1